jgi:hypothetical protein
MVSIDDFRRVCRKNGIIPRGRIVRRLEQKMVFKEVAQPGIWKPENEGDKIEGTLIRREADVGENHSNLYTIEQGNGEIVNVWGSVVLDSRMALVKVGSLIRITYKGLGERSGGKNAPKLFSVEVDDGQDPAVQVEKPSFT